jgi:hypothetical protein
MNLDTFRLLSPRAQLLFVMTQSTYLAHRWDEENNVRNLYHLPGQGRGFFTEIGFNDSRECLVILRSFCSSVPLEEYTQQVQLPT